MLVKAKWNVKDAAGWHDAGQVFETEQDLGDAVEIVNPPKAPEPVKEPEKAEPTTAVKPVNRRRNAK